MLISMAQSTKATVESDYECFLRESYHISWADFGNISDHILELLLYILAKNGRNLVPILRQNKCDLFTQILMETFIDLWGLISDLLKI